MGVRRVNESKPSDGASKGLNGVKTRVSVSSLGSCQKVFWRRVFTGKALLILQATDHKGDSPDYYQRKRSEIYYFNGAG